MSDTDIPLNETFLSKKYKLLIISICVLGVCVISGMYLFTKHTPHTLQKEEPKTFSSFEKTENLLGALSKNSTTTESNTSVEHILTSLSKKASSSKTTNISPDALLKQMNVMNKKN